MRRRVRTASVGSGLNRKVGRPLAAVLAMAMAMTLAACADVDPPDLEVRFESGAHFL